MVLSHKVHYTLRDIRPPIKGESGGKGKSNDAKMVALAPSK